MKSVSIIANGDHLRIEEIQLLRSYIHRFSSKTGLPCEYILYLTNATELQPSKDLSIVHSEVHGFTSLKKAVVSAHGNNLIFTSVANILADKSGLVILQASQLTDFLVAAPMKQNTMLSYLGIRMLLNVPYIITSKSFAVDNNELLSQPARVVRAADRLLSLIKLQPMTFSSPDEIIKRLIFTRPYVSIIKYRIRSVRNIIRNYFEARRVEKLRKQVKPVYYNSDIPVFIICRDRVEPLTKLVEWCEAEGLKNIFFIDNASTYPPLLEYYQRTKHEVIKLNANVGHTSPWDSGIVHLYAANRPFIVTDPDVIPTAESHGAVKHFCKLLNAHPERTKAGFGLKIDDLPDNYELKQSVIAWEKKFWVSLVEVEVYDAEIDTTFAVYRPDTPYVLGPGLRTGGKYVARHEPWYVNSDKPSSEISYYRKHADKNIGSWGTNLSELSDTYSNARYH